MWPKLQSLQNFAEERFLDASRPHIETLKTAIREGTLPGQKIGKRYFVWVGSQGQPLAPADDAATRTAESIIADYELKHADDEAA
jgi:hypothetical protein